MSQYLKIGFIKKPHGIKGEIKVLPLTDDKERFKEIKNVYLDINNQYSVEEIKSVKITPDSVIIKLANYDNINDVEKLRNKYIFIDKKNGVPLSEGEYYTQDLEGCDFYYKDAFLGKVLNVINEGTCDIFVVNMNNKEILYPFLKDHIEKIDIENKKIYISQYEGYFD